MTNLEYVNSLIGFNDIIYIDTSSLMNVEELRKFLESYSQIFIENNKRILVTREVCLEIVKHLRSKMESKQYKAQKVIEIFKEYYELFIFEDNNLNNIEANSAFADSELLSRITRGKTKFRQLLITNDKKLSVDTYNLNNLNSCFGEKISVCYISQDGLLHRGQTDFESRAICEKDKKEEVNVSEEQTVTRITEDKRSKILYVLTGFCLGAVVTKYAPKILKFI